MRFNHGKVFASRMAVECNYEKSASFLQCTILCGNVEAFACLGKKYCLGIRMVKEGKKPLEFYMSGAEHKDPECLHGNRTMFSFSIGLREG